jgi:hypothetical protein
MGYHLQKEKKHEANARGKCMASPWQIGSQPTGCLVVVNPNVIFHISKKLPACFCKKKVHMYRII